MTFEEFCEQATFGLAQADQLTVHRGQREYEARMTAGTRVTLRLRDTRDEAYMAGVELETKRKLYDYLRSELARDVAPRDYWTLDGRLRLQLPKVPEAIEVILPDQRGREVYSARVHRFEERGECEVEGYDDGIDEALDGSMVYETPTWYLSCGHDTHDSDRPRFCPTCGARVVSE